MFSPQPGSRHCLLRSAGLPAEMKWCGPDADVTRPELHRCVFKKNTTSNYIVKCLWHSAGGYFQIHTEHFICGSSHFLRNKPSEMKMNLGSCGINEYF